MHLRPGRKIDTGENRVAGVNEPQADAPEALEAVEPSAGEDAGAAEAPVAAAATPSEPEVQLPPKERRRQARSKHAGEARARGVRVAVAVVDVRGEAIQQDTMDGAPTAGAFVAEAVAAGAATFQLPSAEVDPVLTSVLPYRVLTVPGGVPVRSGSVPVRSGGERVVAGLGVAGADAGTCQEIAEAALA